MDIFCSDPEEEYFISEQGKAVALNILSTWENAKIAEDIVQKSNPMDWKKVIKYPKNASRYCILMMQMQSGKTAVMRYISYLLNQKQKEKGPPVWATRLGLESNRTFVICHVPDRSLLDQTKSRFQPPICERDFVDYCFVYFNIRFHVPRKHNIIQVTTLLYFNNYLLLLYSSSNSKGASIS